MLSSLSADWNNTTQTKILSEERFYLDPRRQEYPVISGTPNYVAISGAYNMPGSYWLSSALTYLFQPGSSISGEIFLKQLTSGADANLIRFLGGYTLTLKRNSAGTYSLVSVGGSTVTSTGGTVQPIQRIGFTFTYGGDQKLYVDGILVDTDTAPALTTNPVFIEINGGAQYVTHVRLFNGYAASDADHADSFKNVAYEETFFSFNKTAYGRSRCNINTVRPGSVTGFSLAGRSGYCSKSASLSLQNIDGQFSDDQFATYAPEVGSYNGLSTQAYLTKNVGVEIETWAPTDTGLYPSTTLYPSTSLYPSGCYYTYEPLFRGIIPSGSFCRTTAVGNKSTVSVSAEDAIEEISRRVVRKPRNVQDYYLSRATPSSNSVLHFIAELATKKEIYNYFTNSGFEDATISNSWGTNGTFSRGNSQVLSGSYCGLLTGTSPNATVFQTVKFEDLTKDEQFTASIWIYATSAITGTFALSDKLTTTTNGTSTTSWTHSGKGWDKISVTHSVVSSSSDRLYCILSCAGSVTSLPIDCAMLKYGGDIPWYVSNTNSGTVYSASSVSEIGSEMSSSYDDVGIVADDVSIQHPWVQLEEGDNVWEEVKNVCDAIMARHCFIDASGVMRIPSMLVSALPTSLGTLPLPSQIGTGQQDKTANKIAVNGVKIVELPAYFNLWMAEAAGIEDDSDEDSKFLRTMADGATFPSASIEEVEYYEAKYDSGADENEDYKKYTRFPTELNALQKLWYWFVSIRGV